MVSEDDDQNLESRPPRTEDVVALCRALNCEGAHYIVIGGIAMVQAGFTRATEDVDLLIESSAENQQRVRKAMLSLPDQAVKEILPTDLDEYLVVRIADEFVVDLMKLACGIRYEEAKDFITYATMNDVTIPFANPELLWRTKQTLREKDKLDLMFLQKLLKK